MNIGILLAAGKSKRFGGNDKLFCLINGKPTIYHSLRFLHDSKRINTIFIVANKNNIERIKKLIENAKFKKVKGILLGGATRYSSVINALKRIPQNAEFLVIHNAANPLAMQTELNACFEKFNPDVFGVAVGRKINSTVKVLKNETKSEVGYTIPRANLREMETPQVVRAKGFTDACQKFSPQKFDYTDDLSVLEQAGRCTAVVDASDVNRKITTKYDMETLRFLSGDFAQSVGFGEDSHRFGKKGSLVLGGVEVCGFPQLEANSDGDVVIHALCNAISSAFGGGSLGTYATKMCQNGIKKSTKYLAYITQEAVKLNKAVLHCAISIEAARPNIDKITPQIKEKLSGLLNCASENIGVTAHSGEKLTPFGRGEAIKCQAVVLLGSFK
ncbi:MAG: 2-C-methyl-D-erythritol 2,4-cyclodiphosphate synthase [Patescibacteria group bacterium]